MGLKAIKFIKEHLAIFAAIAAFFAYPYVIRLLDPTAGTYDAGVLQIIVISVVMFVIFQWATWQVIKSIWPSLGQYAEHFFNNDFKDLLPWQKLRVFLFVYFSVLAAFVFLSKVIS
jgi:hypothetical protein